MNVRQFLEMHAIFRYEHFAALKQSQGVDNPAGIRSALKHYVKSGRIKSLRRNQYAVVPLGANAVTFYPDPYLIAATATDDAVVGYHTALELLGNAYSSFGQYVYLTEQKSKAFEMNGDWFQPVAQPSQLKKHKQSLLYTETLNRQGVTIRVTNAARTFVDVLNRVELSGGWEEVVRSIEQMVVLNIDEVIDYCLILENASLAAKVGYFLSLRQGAFSISEEKLKRLQAAKPLQPTYVNNQQHESSQLIKEWNILLPVSVANQLWNEPNADI